MVRNRFKNKTIPELIQIIQDGDSKAFGEVYDRYVITVFNKCLSFTRDRDDAADLAQEIFIKIYDKIYTFDNRNFGAWLMRITYNQCVDYSRKASNKQKSQYTVEEFDGADSFEEIETDLMDIRLDALVEIMQQLDALDRTFLIMKYQEDKKIKEIAKLYKISDSAVKMRLSRARLEVIKIYNTSYGGK